jgi:hypothetical protein
MRNKKGSMELGINAIVVIIIALAILGLGIGFVTRLFTSASTNFGEIINNNELEFHADSMNPVKFDVKEVVVKRGTTQSVKVSVYNAGTFAEGNKIALKIAECVDSAGVVYTDAEACNPSTGSLDTSTTTECHASAARMAAPSQKISAGIDGGYRAIISVPKDFYGFKSLTDLSNEGWFLGDNNDGAPQKVQPQTYTCTVEATEEGGPGAASTQLYIRVTV